MSDRYLPFSVLVPALPDKDARVRGLAAGSLVQLGQADETVISALVPALQDKDDWVRQNAALSLGQLGLVNETVVSALVPALPDKDKWVRQAVAKSLGNLKIKDSTQLTQTLFALNRLLFSDEKNETLNALRNLFEGRQLPGYRWRSREKRRQFWHRLKYLYSSKHIMFIIIIGLPLPFLPPSIFQVVNGVALAFTILWPLLTEQMNKSSAGRRLLTGFHCLKCHAHSHTHPINLIL